MPAHRKPSALKLLQGTARLDRENPLEPTPDRGVPVAPAHLSATGKKAHAAIAQLLDAMNVVTVADAPILELIASTYSDLRFAEKALHARGSMTYEATSRDSGLIVRVWPEFGIVSDLRKQLLALLVKCGLTPADRSRVSVIDGPGDDDDEFAEFWRRP